MRRGIKAGAMSFCGARAECRTERLAKQIPATQELNARQDAFPIETGVARCSAVQGLNA